jgi:hypothetical protein
MSNKMKLNPMYTNILLNILTAVHNISLDEGLVKFDRLVVNLNLI